MCLMALSAAAGDTVQYTLAACREMALTCGASAQSQQELQLAAEYNRKAALAAMFPKISANGSYLWNSRNLHLLANQTAFSFGTASVNGDGTSSFTWSDQSSLGKIAAEVEGTALEQPIKDLEASAGQRVADAYQEIYNMFTVDITHVVVAQVGVMQPIYTVGV